MRQSDNILFINDVTKFYERYLSLSANIGYSIDLASDRKHGIKQTEKQLLAFLVKISKLKNLSLFRL